MRLSHVTTLALALLAAAAVQGAAQTTAEPAPAPVCPSTHVVCGGSCCSR